MGVAAAQYQGTAQNGRQIADHASSDSRRSRERRNRDASASASRKRDDQGDKPRPPRYDWRMGIKRVALLLLLVTLVAMALTVAWKISSV